MLVAGFIGVSVFTPSAASAAPPQGPVVAASPEDAEKVDEALLTLAQPLPAEAVYNIASEATPAEPIEVKFASGEWSGGIVVTGDSPESRVMIDDFIARNEVAQGSAPVWGVGASASTVDETLESYEGSRTYSPNSGFADTAGRASQSSAGSATTGAIEPESAAAAAAAGPPPGGPGSCFLNTDCTEWANPSTADPSVPQSGQLHQVRMQGLIESTDHTIRGLSKVGYPAIVKFAAMTNGQATIQPLYVYEHDYKVTNNGYVETSDNYTWTSNLPGAYKDTRVSDGIQNGGKLDFTVGAMYTWLFDVNKTYTIRTTVRAPQDDFTPRQTTAMLVGQVLPNDGGFSAAGAAARGGCAFSLNPRQGNRVPFSGIGGDFAWCGGIGANRLGETTLARTYISLTPFYIRYNGTCRNWVLNQGATNC